MAFQYHSNFLIMLLIHANSGLTNPSKCLHTTNKGVFPTICIFQALQSYQQNQNIFKKAKSFSFIDEAQEIKRKINNHNFLTKRQQFILISTSYKPRRKLKGIKGPIHTYTFPNLCIIVSLSARSLLGLCLVFLLHI